MRNFQGRNSRCMEADYLTSVRKQFLYYKKLGEDAMAQISEDQFFLRYNDTSNSIAVIVNHLAGNMLSRFTDFLTSDGEKPWRNRDAEFELDSTNRETYMERWERGWNCLLDNIQQLRPAQLEAIVYIRNEGHSVVEALNRQLAHYPYHIGQIVYIAKICRGKEWDTLSIPKNKSAQYNTKKFDKERSIKHFTDEA